jgi:hypothetical protein
VGLLFATGLGLGFALGVGCGLAAGLAGVVAAGLEFAAPSDGAVETCANAGVASKSRVRGNLFMDLKRANSRGIEGRQDLEIAAEGAPL